MKRYYENKKKNVDKKINKRTNGKWLSIGRNYVDAVQKFAIESDRTYSVHTEI